MYYALNDLEKVSGVSQIVKKKKIIDALIRRKTACGGAFYHKSFKSGTDTQLRATSSVIRTMLMAEKDGIYFKEELNEIVKHHFSYFFEWGSGIWFCHDSSEKEGETPLSHLKTTQWGKGKRNTVTLNTHLDSLSTLLILVYEKPDFLGVYQNSLNRAIVSLNFVLATRNNNTKFGSFSEKIDNYLFKKYVKKIIKPNLIDAFYQKIMHPFFFKLVKPTLFFENGFIGRDISVCNIHVDYLLVNIVDFLRLIVCFDMIKSDDKIKIITLDRTAILEVVEKAVELIETNNVLKENILISDIQKAWYAELHYLRTQYTDKSNAIVEELHASNKYNMHNTYFTALMKKRIDLR